MKVTGAARLSQPPGTVWPALNDPAVLARAIPGCERLDVTGSGACALTVLTGIAAVAGSYAGEARAVERAAPGLLRATVSGSGNRGQVGADVTVRLELSGGAATEVSYEADIRAQGPVAAVGQLVLASIARRLATQFLAGIESALVAVAADAAGIDGAAGGDCAAGADGADGTHGADGADATGTGGTDGTDGAQGTGRGVGVRGVGVRGAVAPAGERPAPGRSPRAARAGVLALARLPAGVRAGLAAGAGAVLAGFVIGFLAGRRARAGRR